jgi:hypothetical protein
VTFVPEAKSCEQSPGQAMPPGTLETTPVPAPVLVTVNRREDGTIDVGLKLAATDRFPPIRTRQGPVPEHAPLQPSNFDFASGVGVSTTRAFRRKVAVHWEPQSMPAGVLVTFPLPLPPFPIVSGYGPAKVALTCVRWDT